MSETDDAVRSEVGACDVTTQKAWVVDGGVNGRIVLVRYSGAEVGSRSCSVNTAFSSSSSSWSSIHVCSAFCTKLSSMSPSGRPSVTCSHRSLLHAMVLAETLRKGGPVRGEMSSYCRMVMSVSRETSRGRFVRVDTATVRTNAGKG